MKFELLDYEAVVSYNKEQHYPFKVTLINTRESKEVFYGEHVTVDQLCFNVHRERCCYTIITHTNQCRRYTLLKECEMG